MGANGREFPEMYELAVGSAKISARLDSSGFRSFAFLLFVLRDLFIAVRIRIPRSKHRVGTPRQFFLLAHRANSLRTWRMGPSMAFTSTSMSLTFPMKSCKW